ncbi:MAG: zinc metallopeptidase [Candidatus Xenobiia bacterium LiM19]
MFFDPLYLMLVIPFVILSLYASVKVQTTFKRYSQVSSSSGLTGGRTAEILLREGGPEFSLFVIFGSALGIIAKRLTNRPSLSIMSLEH